MVSRSWNLVAIWPHLLFRCFGKRVVLRSTSVGLLFAFCSTGLPQITDEANSHLPKSFHDDGLNITYFYPADFMPVPSASTIASTSDMANCIQTTLSANSVARAGASSFTLSTIDNTCPDTLRDATQLGPFVHERILRQLKQYGEPVITQEPTRYTIDGRPSAITLASVPMPATPGRAAQITYAAKACALGVAPIKRRKKSEPVEPISRVLCFDFTTQNSDLLNLMFSFIIQFGNDSPEPMFPGSALRRH
jgi:hypothetical protein